MDTLVGYVSYVFDAETVKLIITQQDNQNEFTYDSEEKVKLSDYLACEGSSKWRSIADIKLVDDLLFKKIEVKIEKRDPYELTGKISELGT